MEWGGESTDSGIVDYDLEPFPTIAELIGESLNVRE